MAKKTTLGRYVEEALKRALSYSPVVLLHGARQSGKTTFVRQWGARNKYEYMTFDDYDVLQIATNDPMGFIRRLTGPTIIDEVQRVPEIFRSIKLVVDENRQHGQFILTGSTNVLKLPRLGDSLAGRMSIVDMYTLSQTEMQQKPSQFLDRLFNNSWPTKKLQNKPGFPSASIVQGGYPALLHYGSRPPYRWYQDYIKTLFHRDITDVYNIQSLDSLEKIFHILAAQTSTTLAYTKLSDALEVSRTTVKQYFAMCIGFDAGTVLPYTFLWAAK